jgi:hypothetical protein
LAFVLVLVLVLEDVVFSEVAELRESAGSELHPRSGSQMLKGRKIFVVDASFSQYRHNLWIRSYRPLWGGAFLKSVPGVKNPRLSPVVPSGQRPPTEGEPSPPPITNHQSRFRTLRYFWFFSLFPVGPGCA